MAEQKGIIRIKGKIGDLSFYRGDGKDLVKTPGGATKEQIMSQPEFARLRENMSEFGGAAHIGKAFRGALGEVLPVMKGKFFSARVTGMFSKLGKLGAGVRGERAFEIVTNSYILTGFNFNRTKILSSIFSAPFTLVANVDRNETTFNVPDFNTAENGMRLQSIF